MRAFWTFLTVVVVAATFAFWIIPAILEWQKNRHYHEANMADKLIELKRVSEPKEKPKTGIKEKMTSFFEKTITEVVPALAGKMLGGA